MKEILKLQSREFWEFQKMETQRERHKKGEEEEPWELVREVMGWKIAFTKGAGLVEEKTELGKRV